MNAETTAGIGHNQPPEAPTPAVILDGLKDRHSELVARKNQLLNTGATVPAVIEDEETAKRLADLLAMFRDLLKQTKGQFELEKAPYLTAGRAVDGFFTAGIKDPIERMGSELKQRQLRYVEAKAEKERARLRAEAEAQRAEADRKAREAAEAETKRLAAEAEARRVAALQANPNAGQEPAPAPQSAPSKAETDLLQQAASADQAAAQLERKAEAKPSELGRVRGDLGGVSTIRKIWTGEMTDRAKLDLEALRPHLGEEALNKACAAYARAHGEVGKPAPVLAGARIWEKAV